jgi:hypothetical protein
MPGIRKAAVAVLAILAGAAILPALSQVPGQPPSVQPPAAQRPAAISPAEMERLVARIALYPDELLAVVLRASTAAVQVVQAARYLERAAKDKSLKPNAAWTQPILILVNYPDVLRRMNDDLDWTERLGEAVETQQGDVLSAVQRFRHRVAAAGNLKSDGKVTVVDDHGAYVIESVDPKVIYVPVYDPAVVVIAQPQPAPVVYEPTPYPAYYDPYASALFGYMAGALTTAWVMDWHNYDIDEDDIREFQQSRQQSITDRQKQRQDAAQQRQQQRQDARTERQGDRQQQRPAGSGGAGQQQDLRAILGGERPAQGALSAGGSRLPAQGGINWGGGERPGYQPQRPPGQGFEGRRDQGGAFDYGSRRDAFEASDRGARSRNFQGGNFAGGNRSFSGGRNFGGGRGRR